MLPLVSFLDVVLYNVLAMVTVAMGALSLCFQMIATTALYLAGKIEEQELRLTDVINVCHRLIMCYSDDYMLLAGNLRVTITCY